MANGALTDEELDAALYDLFLVGCYHWRNSDASRAVTPAYPMLGGLWRAGCYRQFLNRPLVKRSELRNRVQLSSHVVHAQPGTRASEETMTVEAQKAPADALLVMMVRPRRGDELLKYDKILGSGGYPLFLTPAGMAYAAAAAVRYPDLTQDVFVAGHDRFWLLRSDQRQV